MASKIKKEKPKLKSGNGQFIEMQTFNDLSVSTDKREALHGGVQSASSKTTFSDEGDSLNHNNYQSASLLSSDDQL